MCRSMRYTCMPNIKLLSSILQYWILVHTNIIIQHSTCFTTSRLIMISRHLFPWTSHIILGKTNTYIRNSHMQTVVGRASIHVICLKDECANHYTNISTQPIKIKRWDVEFSNEFTIDYCFDVIIMIAFIDIRTILYEYRFPFVYNSMRSFTAVATIYFHVLTIVFVIWAISSSCEWY